MSSPTVPFSSLSPGVHFKWLGMTFRKLNETQWFLSAIEGAKTASSDSTLFRLPLNAVNLDLNIGISCSQNQQVHPLKGNPANVPTSTARDVNDSTNIPTPRSVAAEELEYLFEIYDLAPQETRKTVIYRFLDLVAEFVKEETHNEN